MANTKVYTECIICADGQAGGVPCSYCSGNEVILWGELEIDLGVLLGKSFKDNLVATYQILEATDTDEYNALSDSNKNAYNMALQCGIVDLTDGTQVRANLWAMFDSESTTRANLITLLGE